MNWWGNFKSWVSGKLVPEAKHWWRIFSVQMMAAAAALQGAYDQYGETLRNYLSHDTVAKITIGLLLAGIVGRLIPQKVLTQTRKEQDQ